MNVLSFFFLIAEPHTLENLETHRSQNFWMSRDCPYVPPYVGRSVRPSAKPRILKNKSSTIP